MGRSKVTLSLTEIFFIVISAEPFQHDKGVFTKKQ